jgi:hypothetical protein
MDSLGSYLQKFYKLTPHARTVQDACATVISRELGCYIAPEHISVRDDVVQVQASPALKQAVFMKRAQLLACINAELQPAGKSVRRLT